MPSLFLYNVVMDYKEICAFGFWRDQLELEEIGRNQKTREEIMLEYVDKWLKHHNDVSKLYVTQLPFNPEGLRPKVIMVVDDAMMSIRNFDINSFDTSVLDEMYSELKG